MLSVHLRVVLVAGVLGSMICGQSVDLDSIRSLPTLDAQRFKPLDSLARETILVVTGRAALNDEDPLATYFSWLFSPTEAAARDLIKLPDARNARELGFTAEEILVGRVSAERLASNGGFMRAVREAVAKPDDLRTERDREALRLHGRWSLFGAVTGAAVGHGSQRITPSGQPRGYLPVLPPQGEMQEGVPYRWSSPVEADPRHAAALGAFMQLAAAFRTDDAAAFDAAAGALRSAVAASGYPSAFPGDGRMEREVRLNRFQPFRLAAILYALGAFVAALVLAARRFPLAALPVVAAAFVVNVWGLVERTALSERAMIGNLYESLVFVAAAAAIVGLIFALRERTAWFALGGALLAAIALTAALSFPDAMNPKITALRPVLVNNFWIHIHVPTIMASYAALGLSWVLAHLWLVRFIAQPRRTAPARTLARFIYAVLPIGLILLLAGMVLGGVWADASWGRFWGWDPKETWSFVTWLVFLVIVHGRWAGWLGDFGIAQATMVGGWALLWTYYGVNFFQSGLHSYAGAGGPASPPPWFWVFGGFELGLCLAAFWRRRGTQSRPLEFSAVGEVT